MLLGLVIKISGIHLVPGQLFSPSTPLQFLNLSDINSQTHSDNFFSEFSGSFPFKVLSKMQQHVSSSSPEDDIPILGSESFHKFIPHFTSHYTLCLLVIFILLLVCTIWSYLWPIPSAHPASCFLLSFHIGQQIPLTPASAAGSVSVTGYSSANSISRLIFPLPGLWLLAFSLIKQSNPIP